jgi:hypothetical protein
MYPMVAFINTPSQLGSHSLSCQVSHGCILNFVSAGVIEACEATLLLTLDSYILFLCDTQGHRVLFFYCIRTMANFTVEHQLDLFFRSTVLSSQSKSIYPAYSVSHWRHISGCIQLGLVYISIHVLLLS